jgi:hypothetical protein
LNYSKKVHEIFSVIKKLGLKEIFKNMFYKERVEVVSMVFLDEKKNFSFENKLKIRSIEREDSTILKEFTQKYHHHVAASVKVDTYLKNGYSGFLAFQGDTLIGYMWWVDNKIEPEKNHPELIRYDIKLENGDVYTTDLFIAPVFRVKNNSLEFSYRAYKELYKFGFKRAYGVVDLNNAPARWTYKLLGCKETLRITSKRYFIFFLLVNRSLFLKTSRWNRTHPMDFRLLYTFKKA